MDDVTALSDAQLVELMDQHRRPDGNFELSVGGWDGLSTEKRDELARRLLKAQECVLARNPVACSRPLDLAQLDARLAQLSDGSGMPNLGSGELTPTEPYDDDDELADLRREETVAYHDLVNDGGRPLYPISLLEHVSTDPYEYRDMLWPFWEYPPAHSRPWLVYKKQRRRWLDFRNWQNDHRGLEEDEDDAFSAYVEGIKILCGRYQDSKELAKIEADPESIRPVYEADQRRRRRWQRRWQREPDCQAFADYVDAVKRRLSQHDFTQPFHLHIDPKLQDRSSTWIEYLCFECWWLDRHTTTAERHKLSLDKCWQELREQEIVLASETRHFVLSIVFSTREDAAYYRAREAKEVAESEGIEIFRLTQEDAHRLDIPEDRRICMLRAATDRLLTANKRFGLAKKRRDTIVSFYRVSGVHKEAEKDGAHHTDLVQWVLQQCSPLVADSRLDKETPEPDEAENNKRGAGSEPSHKRQKSGPGALGLPVSSATPPRRAPSSVSDDRSGSCHEPQSPRDARPPARRMLRSTERASALSSDSEPDTRRPDLITFIEVPKYAANHRGRTGKRRRDDVSPVDYASTMRSEKDAQAKLSAEESQVAKLGPNAGRRRDDSAKRGSKRQKVKHPEGSRSGGKPILAEARGNPAEAKSTMAHDGSRALAADAAAARLRRSARLAAR